MKPKKYVLTILAILLITAVLSGCSRTTFTYHIREDVDFSFFKRVAVMPIENMTTDKFASEIVRQAVISELLATGAVDVVVPGDVMYAIDRLGIKTVALPTSEQIKNIGKILNVQGVILGSVEKFGDERLGGITAPAVTITLMLADTSSGGIVWSTTRSKGGASFAARHFGARTDTLSEITIKVVRESLRTLVGHAR